jgi:hypothetical protein
MLRSLRLTSSRLPLPATRFLSSTANYQGNGVLGIVRESYTKW